jgi:hypothetical protein
MYITALRPRTRRTMTKEEITELRGDLELLTKEELIEILIDKEKEQASKDKQAPQLEYINEQ